MGPVKPRATGAGEEQVGGRAAFLALRTGRGKDSETFQLRIPKCLQVLEDI